MTDVFISYSRKDITFARLLHEALVENGLETWIDWQIANRDLISMEWRTNMGDRPFEKTCP